MSHTLEERCRQLMIQRKFEQCQKEIETAMAENPHCAIPHNLMGILLEKESNKGAGGVDGMSVDELLSFLRDNGMQLKQHRFRFACKYRRRTDDSM